MTKSQQTKAVAIAGAALAITGIFFLVKYFYKKKKDDGTGENVFTQTLSRVTNLVKPDFPLQKGSKNSYVKQLQQALINTYGASVLPKYGADGDWGSETDAAVKNKLGISSIPDKQTLRDIINSINP